MLQVQASLVDGKPHSFRLHGLNRVQGATETAAEFFVLAGHPRFVFMTAHLPDIVKFCGGLHPDCLPACVRTETVLFQGNMAAIVLD
jgi:hypothetical protein